MDKKAILKKAVKILLVLGLAGCLFLFLINLYMIRKEKPNIISSDDAAALGDVDCIMVLGCSVRPDGTPSGMLRDRLDKGIGLYEDGVSDRLLMSGDHGRKNYDEVNRMKQYAIDEGIPSGDIFMDHAGFSTYESMYRARDIFQVKKIIIVTQRYHMYRALYVAQAMGLAAPQITYLVHDLKENGIDIDDDITTVAEAREAILALRNKLTESSRDKNV